ncbi:uncharacterized protein LOC128270862 [Anopheles cruzii]|uniref:uncharacterized protein LOC128270862 n=1 Tax=Anopheles cruzii TaxID=68878 RepID=UPI0022EC733A|nr:uncharacterized protein LOC128270862 [Anopheles cruzii]
MEEVSNSQQLLALSLGDEVDLFHVKISGQQILLVRHQRTLYCFRLESGPNGPWRLQWSRERFFDGTSVRDLRHSLFVTDSGWLLLRNRNGLQFYRLEGNELTPQVYASAAWYHSMYGWNEPGTVFLMGHFYTDRERIGVLSRNKRGSVRLEQMVESAVLAGGAQPLWQLSGPSEVPDTWKQKTTHLQLALVDGSNQSAIIERAAPAKLTLHKFTENNQLQTIAHFDDVPFTYADKECIVFGHFLGDTEKDFLHFTNSGLTLYERIGNTFRAALQDPSFGISAFGWTEQHWRTINLIDGDGDAKDQLWLSGPQGIAGYRVSTAGVEKISTNYELPDDARFARKVAIIPVGAQSMVVAVAGKTLMSFALPSARSVNAVNVPEIGENGSTNDEVGSSDPIFTNNPRVGPVVEGSLAEQLDTSVLVEPINPFEGNLNFALPLLRVGKLLSIITTKHVFYREADSAGTMGRGWSLGIDCIFVDRRDSIFEEDHRYYLSKDGSTTLLTPTEGASFQLEDNNRTMVSHDRTGNKWEIVYDDGQVYTYGSDTSIKWDIGSEDWPFVLDERKYGNRKDQVIPSIWYLTHHNDREGDQWMHYTYREQSGSRDLLLNTITTSGGASLQMSYSQQFGETLFTSFAINTPSYSQTVSLQYVEVEGQVSLRRITQAGKTVLQFAYGGPGGTMNEIVYPNGLMAKFDYTQLQIDPDILMNRFETFSQPRAEYGPSYLLVCDVTAHGQVRVRMRDFLGSDTIPVAGSPIPALGKRPVIQYEVFTGETYFAVLLYHGQEKEQELCLFSSEENVWQADPSYINLPHDTAIRSGQDFLLAIQSQRVTVIERSNGKWKAQKPFAHEKTALLFYFSHGFLTYDDQLLKIHTRGNGQWLPVDLELASDLITTSSAVFDHFQHAQPVLDNLKAGILPDALSMYHNVVVFRSLALEGTRLYCRLHLLHLNRNHRVARREVIQLLIEDLSSYTFNPPEIEGNVFQFGYRLEGTKFRLKVLEHTGKVMEEIDKIKQQIEEDIRDQPNAPEREKERYRQESHAKLSEELAELHRNVTAQVPFAIDPGKFGVITNAAYIIAASHKVRYDGVAWNEERIPQSEITLDRVSVELGSKYRLMRAHQNATFDLVGPDGSVVFNTETRDASELQIRYPAYLATHRNGSTVQLYDFDRARQTNLPADETLSVTSNQLAVISTTGDGKALLVRSMKAFRVTLQNVVYRHTLLDSQTGQRKLSYFYDFDPRTAKPYGTDFLMTDVQITPGSRSAPYGWFQEQYDAANSTRSTKSVFSSDGKLVKVVAQSTLTDEQHKPLDLDGILTGRDGRTVIADLRPYKLSQNVVSYYGFEPYERNFNAALPASKRWTWSQGAVREEDGNHFLRLGHRSSLSGVFHPTNPVGTLIVSCWLRSVNASNAIGSALSVHQNSKTINGEVRFVMDGWNFVEAFAESTARFEIQVSSDSDFVLDVDHLRVTPAHLNTEVYIYDHLLAVKRSTLLSSGLLAHHLHDAFGNEVGRITENGMVDSLTLRSRVHNSRVEFKSAIGELLRTTRSNSYSGSLKYIPQTLVLRFRYAAIDSGVVTVKFDARSFTLELSKGSESLRERNHSVRIPGEGELAIFCTRDRYSVWVDGELKMENFAEEIRFQRYEIQSAKGNVWEAIMLYDAGVSVIYSTGFGLPKQLVELKSAALVVIQEILYDELNRPAIKTKWTEIDASSAPELFGYRHDFVRNETDFWKTERLQGLVAELNVDCEGYAYSRTVYANTPLDDIKTVQSFPGKQFSTRGAFAKHFDRPTRIDFLENLFPAGKGFRYEYERYPDQAVTVTVSVQDRKMAYYVRTHHGDHRLTTYQYDSEGRLVLQLPPSYHEEADTYSMTSPFLEGTFSSDQLQLQHAWGTRYEFDRTSGLVSSKRTPDAGTVRYLYTPEGLLRFVVRQKQRTAMYFTYSPVGELAQKGVIELGLADLKNLLPNDSDLPVSSNAVLFNHNPTDLAPQHRHRVQSSRKVTNEHTLSELLLFDHHEHLIASTLYSTSNSSHSLPIAYKYRNNLIHELHYPISVRGKNFRLRYDYDARGKVVGLVNVASGEKYVVIENNSLGLPKTMTLQPGSPHAYSRKFTYNQPGYLTQIMDPYLTESIDYTGHGYGGLPIGDGTVQTTRFNATWHADSESRLLELKSTHFGTTPRAKLCFGALKSAGLIDTSGRPARSLYPALELNLPTLCRLGAYGHRVASLLNERGFPQIYGHMYDYGNHRQLIRAKYFQNPDEAQLEPLRSSSLAKVNGLNTTTAAVVWNRLVEAGFIHRDCRSVREIDCHGLPGKSLLHPVIQQHPNGAALGALLLRMMATGKRLTESVFRQLCTTWYRDGVVDPDAVTCNSLWSTLLNNGFVGTDTNGLEAISPELRTLLKDYILHLPAIVEVLYRQHGTALGLNSGDVQSYGIDGNGNHRHFYTGFRRYRLEYVKRTNKIAAVYRTDLASDDQLEVRFPMDHNEDGSVTRALHKGIERIVYDTLLNRATEITLTDGRRVVFDYNVRGQRLSKRCYDQSGKLLRKKHYVRDVQGKPLIEYEARYDGDNATGNGEVRATIFLYADDRLIGFLRDDQFYSVALDHEGSVRLVVRNGEIVAAYDYLSYGELLRSYGEDANGQLDYRYTGKEWDEETRLYDFHARLYDPELGRFFQMDPKEQYASPYVYTGNSPISLVDPDGQFAFIVAVVVLASAGAYLGAAAANNSWNPAKWNLKQALLGGLIGGLIGGFAPAGFAGSFAVLSGAIGTVGATAVMTVTTAGFGYLSIASANSSWDPRKWHWSQPGTWNALFAGSISGGGLFNAVGKLHSIFQSATVMQRVGLTILTTGVTGGFLLYGGSRANDGNLVFWKWDWSKPGTVWGAVEGTSFGLTLTPHLVAAVPEIVKRVEKLKEIGRALRESSSGGNLEAIGTMVKAELLAWRKIYSDIKGRDMVRFGLSNDLHKKAQSRLEMHLGSAINPKGAMELIDKVLEAEELIGALLKKNRRSISFYGSTTLPSALSNVSQLATGFPAEENLLFMVSGTDRVFHWLNRLFHGLFGGSSKYGSFYQATHTNVQHFSREESAERKKSFVIPNCFIRTSDTFDRIVCYEQPGVSFIFPHNHTEPTIAEDNYSWCYPVEYEGHPSVACSGSTSSYIFTPYRGHVNYLDHVNGTLTLLLVLPAIARSVVSFVGSMVTGKVLSTNSSEIVSSDEQTNLKRQLHRLHRVIDGHVKLLGSSVECEWFKSIAEDIEDDVRTFVGSVGPSRVAYQELIDRIWALEEELLETQDIVATMHNDHSLRSEPLQKVDFLPSAISNLAASGMLMPLDKFMFRLLR